MDVQCFWEGHEEEGVSAGPSQVGHRKGREKGWEGRRGEGQHVFTSRAPLQNKFLRSRRKNRGPLRTAEGRKTYFSVRKNTVHTLAAWLGWGAGLAGVVGWLVGWVGWVSVSVWVSVWVWVGLLDGKNFGIRLPYFCGRRYASQIQTPQAMQQHKSTH